MMAPKTFASTTASSALTIASHARREGEEILACALQGFQRCGGVPYRADFGMAHRRFKYRRDEHGFLGCNHVDPVLVGLSGALLEDLPLPAGSRHPIRAPVVRR